MVQFLYYDSLVALNRDSHKNLRIKPAEAPFSFAKEVSSVPLAAAEFALAAHEYPVVFAGESLEKVAPVALLGIGQGQNTYVDEDGNWGDAYRPAFIRQYPFVLADTGKEDLTVCIDENFEGLNEDEGEALFNDDGSESDMLKRALEFLRDYRVQMQRTADFTKKLVELELLTPRTVQIRKADGKQINLQGMFVVDENKLRELSDEDALGLFRTGGMAAIYAHLMSVRNLTRLNKRANESAEAA